MSPMLAPSASCTAAGNGSATPAMPTRSPGVRRSAPSRWSPKSAALNWVCFSFVGKLFQDFFNQQGQIWAIEA